MAVEFGMKKIQILGLSAAALSLASCGVIEEMMKDSDSHEWSFGKDLAFFAEYKGDCVVLGEGESFVVVSSKWQARVMTSTLDGEDGVGIGWYNRSLIASNKPETYINKLGGEDSFKVGPEGGEHSLFFAGGKVYTADNWTPPAIVSSEPWTLIAQSKAQAKFEKAATVENARGRKFNFLAEREISYISREDAKNILGTDIPDSVKCVAYQSLNKITNTGDADWTQDYGMLNISVNSCYHANNTTAAFVPYKTGDVAKLGDIMRNEYSATSAMQLYSIEPDYVKFILNARKIEEIGINALRSKGIFMVYDEKNSRLTITTYMRPPSAKGYLPASWRSNEKPGEGDAITFFNNGPAEEGAFYAIPYYRASTHSPALALPAGKSQFHLQRTFHFKGSEYELGRIAEALTGVTMQQMRKE